MNHEELGTRIHVQFPGSSLHCGLIWLPEKCPCAEIRFHEKGIHANITIIGINDAHVGFHVGFNSDLYGEYLKETNAPIACIGEYAEPYAIKLAEWLQRHPFTALVLRGTDNAYHRLSKELARMDRKEWRNAISALLSFRSILQREKFWKILPICNYRTLINGLNIWKPTLIECKDVPIIEALDYWEKVEGTLMAAELLAR